MADTAAAAAASPSAGGPALLFAEPPVAAWLRANGVWWDTSLIELCRDAGSPSPFNRSAGGASLGVFARAPIAQAALLAVIPEGAILSPRTSALAPILEAERLGGGLALTAAVMYEASLGAESKWAGYLASLPRPCEYLPMFWQPDEVALLAGTELGDSQWQADRDDTAEDYSSHVLPLLAKYPAAFPAPAACGLEAFRAAASWVASRCFHVDGWHGDAMLPLADIFNHKASLVALDEAWQVAEHADATAAAADADTQAPGRDGVDATRSSGMEHGSGSSSSAGGSSSSERECGSNRSSSRDAGEGSAVKAGSSSEAESSAAEADGMPSLGMALAAPGIVSSDNSSAGAGGWMRDGLDLRLEIGICSLGEPDSRVQRPAPGSRVARALLAAGVDGAAAGAVPCADADGEGEGVAGSVRSTKRARVAGAEQPQQQDVPEAEPGQPPSPPRQQQQRGCWPRRRLEIVAASGIAAGAEVHNTYGELSNAELLHKYGFCLPCNPFDEVTLGASWSWLLIDLPGRAGGAELVAQLAPGVEWLRQHSHLLADEPGSSEGGEDGQPASCPEPPAVTPGARLTRPLAAVVRLLGVQAEQLQAWDSLDAVLEPAVAGEGRVYEQFADVQLASRSLQWWGRPGLQLLEQAVRQGLCRYPCSLQDSEQQLAAQQQARLDSSSDCSRHHAVAVTGALTLRVGEQRCLTQVLTAVHTLLEG